MDLRYSGVKKDFPSLKTRLPVKKKRGELLSRTEKKYNKKLSKERVIVEHSIARLKKFEVIGNEFRNRLNGYDDAFSIVSGLVNFRLMRQEGFDLTAFIG